MEVQDENKNKFLGFSFFKKDDMSFGSYFFKNGENLLMKPLDPKLVSAMVTSAVAKIHMFILLVNQFKKG